MEIYVTNSVSFIIKQSVKFCTKLAVWKSHIYSDIGSLNNIKMLLPVFLEPSRRLFYMQMRWTSQLLFTNCKQDFIRLETSVTKMIAQNMNSVYIQVWITAAKNYYRQKYCYAVCGDSSEANYDRHIKQEKFALRPLVNLEIIKSQRYYRSTKI